jgi:peptidoglycan/LPS O-acetylase OafA/YrhL
MTESRQHLGKLDAIRGFAAVYVVVYHVVHQLDFIPGYIKLGLFSFGQEAVMLFFLLSGFVICWSLNKSNNHTFGNYFIKRFRRIYFPFIIAILLSIVIFAINGSLAERFSWENLAGNLLMLQDFSAVKPGTWVTPFLSNYPLWSLSYEWWFYLLFFPLYKFLPRNPSRIYFILIISALGFLNYNLIPNQAALFLSYFIIWWCGVEAAEIFLYKRKFTLQNMQPIIFCLLFMLGICAVPVLATKTLRFGYYPFLTFRHFLAAFIAIIVGLFWYWKKLKYFDKIFGIFGLIAPISYAMYIFHYPILKYLPVNIYIPNLWVSYFIQFALIIGLAYLTEIKLQPLVNKWLK